MHGWFICAACATIRPQATQFKAVKAWRRQCPCGVHLGACKLLSLDNTCSRNSRDSIEQYVTYHMWEFRYISLGMAVARTISGRKMVFRGIPKKRRCPRDGCHSRTAYKSPARHCGKDINQEWWTYFSHAPFRHFLACPVITPRWYHSAPLAGPSFLQSFWCFKDGLSWFKYQGADVIKSGMCGLISCPVSWSTSAGAKPAFRASSSSLDLFISSLVLNWELVDDAMVSNST